MLSSRTQLEHLGHGFWDSALASRERLSEEVVRPRVRSLLTLRWLNERFATARLALSTATRTEGSVYFREDELEREKVLDDARLYRAAGVPWVPLQARWGRIYTRAQQQPPRQVLRMAFERLEQSNTPGGQAGVIALSALWRERGPSSRTLREWLKLVDRLGLTSPLPTLEVLEHLLGAAAPPGIMPGLHGPTLSEQRDPGGRAAELISGLETQVREFEHLVRRLGGQIKNS